MKTNRNEKYEITVRSVFVDFKEPKLFQKYFKPLISQLVYNTTIAIILLMFVIYFETPCHGIQLASKFFSLIQLTVEVHR